MTAVPSLLAYLCEPEPEEVGDDASVGVVMCATVPPAGAASSQPVPAVPLTDRITADLLRAGDVVRGWTS